MSKKSGLSVKLRNAIYEELKRLAKAKTPETYGDFGHKFGFLPGDAHFENNQLWSILGDFSISECEAGRPMISALIYRADTGMPGNGFFKLAEELYPKLKLNTEDKRREFFYSELNKLFACWEKA
jgi:hypothetical protein